MSTARDGVDSSSGAAETDALDEVPLSAATRHVLAPSTYRRRPGQALKVTNLIIDSRFRDTNVWPDPNRYEVWLANPIRGARRVRVSHGFFRKHPDESAEDIYLRTEPEIPTYALADNAPSVARTVSNTYSAGPPTVTWTQPKGNTMIGACALHIHMPWDSTSLREFKADSHQWFDLDLPITRMDRLYFEFLCHRNYSVDLAKMLEHVLYIEIWSDS